MKRIEFDFGYSYQKYFCALTAAADSFMQPEGEVQHGITIG